MSTSIASDFEGFPKIGRLNRDCIITEKIDGTNAQIFIEEIVDGSGGLELALRAGTKNQWITPGKNTDNFGFAAWVEEHREELRLLGPGRHFGEWWGRGINRGYGLQERRFSLFNVTRWCLSAAAPECIPDNNPKAEPKYQEHLPPCVGLVPILYRGPFTTSDVTWNIDHLRQQGSKAAPGFMNPEGVVVFHPHANALFKVTVENDGVPKSLV